MTIGPLATPGGQRWRDITLYLFPCLLLVWVHQNASHTWFFMDDFAWLGLPREVYSARDLLPTLFEPRAQGTVRVLSERLFFLVFGSVFGMKAAPFHYWVFLTQCVSLVLANAIARRLSGGSVAVGCAVASVWAMSPDLSIPLAWLSSYNQILCACLALASFYFLLRFLDTGRRRDKILAWTCYLLGFLALEVMVVYPFFACTYVWFTARDRVRRVAWLLVPSLAFTALHFMLVPKTPSPVYQMVFDAAMVTNLGRYAFKAIGPSDLARFQVEIPASLGRPVTWAMIAALTAFLVAAARRREWTPFFGLLWFVLFLGPLLPLKNHFSEYYIAIPSFGFALITGWAAVWTVQRAEWTSRLTVAVLAGLFLWCNVAEARGIEAWYRRLSHDMRRLLEGMETSVARSGADTVLLTGIQDHVFVAGFLDNPFRLYGVRNVRLAPGWESAIHSVPPERNTYKIDADQAASYLASPKTAVLAFDGTTVTDVTGTYKAVQSSQQRITTIRLSDGLAATRLGPGWNDAENGFRWMPKRGVVRIDTPHQADAHLMVQVYGNPLIFESAPGRKVELSATVNGHPLPTQAVPEGLETLDFGRIPAAWLNAAAANEIELSVSHTISPPGDGRELGLPVLEVSLRGTQQ